MAKNLQDEALVELDRQYEAALKAADFQGDVNAFKAELLWSMEAMQVSNEGFVLRKNPTGDVEKDNQTDDVEKKDSQTEGVEKTSG